MGAGGSTVSLATLLVKGQKSRRLTSNILQNYNGTKLLYFYYITQH